MTDSEDIVSSFVEFEKKVDAIIQAYVYYEGEVPTYEYLLNETHTNIEAKTSFHRKCHRIIFLVLEELKEKECL
jgi:hypothetical protein